MEGRKDKRHIRQIPDPVWSYLRAYAPETSPVKVSSGGKRIGRTPLDPKRTMEIILHKLATGIGWSDLPSGTSAFRHFQKLQKKKQIPALWKTTIEHAVDLGISEREQIGATGWLIQQKLIRESVKKWLGFDQKDLKSTPEVAPEVTPEVRPKRKRNLAPIYEIPDDLWERIEPILEAYFPKNKRGRPRKNFREVLNGIIHQMRSGCQWRLVPKHYGHYNTIHGWMMKWRESGVLDTMLETVIREAESMNLVDWEWQALDGSLGKSKRQGEACGANPTDRSKGGVKRSLLVEGNGYPISIIIDGANIPDKSLIAKTLEERIKPLAPPGNKPTLIVDRGYRGKPCQATIEAEGYIYRAPPRDRKDPYQVLDVPLNRRERAVRGQVERCHAWLQNYRGIHTRWGYRRDTYESVLKIAAMLIWWKRIAEHRQIQLSQIIG